MNLVALDIPDEPTDLPLWLERRLVGLDLAALVAELSAVHGPAAGPEPSLAKVLGDRRAAVLSDGLTVLPDEALQQLLRHPALLLDLQDAVLSAGESYWSDVAQQEPLRLRSARGKRRLERFLAEAEAGEAPAIAARPRHAARWFAHPAVVGLAAAAAILIGVFLWGQTRSNGPGGAVAWGWAKPGGIPQATSREAYLNGLADSADQWFKQRPTEPAPLAKRINEFRQGCSALLLSEHKPLPAADKAWLLERCRAWAGKLDAQLAALENGQDVATVEAATDEIAHKLSDALRTRAKQGAA
ncbi:MAG TPA: hypothetical protein VFE24_03645 [Pirellulales bacterium]|jgi:hypothetical protein|nr:hypothetical protein [Pirellulales bacterium]